MNSAVGSFTKSTGAATANQSVTGLSFAPTCVFLWTSGNTSQDAWAASARFAFGFATGSAGRSVGFAAQDAQGFSNATRRFATKALSIVEWGESVLAECDLTLTSDGFDLAWTTNNAVAYHINYLAIDPANASIVDWDHNTTGNKSVTGAGFTPELVIHLTAWAQAATTTGVDAFFCLGAMTSAAQWALNTGDADNQTTSISTGCVVDDGCLIRQNLTTMALDFKATYVSMDSDGFTVNWTGLSSQRFFSSLCLAGEDYALGVEAKTTGAATATDSVTGPGFEPAAVLLAINANVTATATGTQHARFAIGASDGTNERAAAYASQDNIGTSVVDSYMASAKAIVKANNGTPAIDAQADLAMTSNGFDLSWTTNDAVATLVPWVAFGPVGGGASVTAEVAAAGTSTAAFAASVAKPVAFSAAGVSSEQIAASVAKPVAVAATGASTAAFGASVAKPVAVAATGSSNAVFAASVAKPVAFAAAGVSTASFDAATEGGVTADVAAAGQSAATFAASVTKPVAVVASGQSAVALDGRVARQAQLSVSATSGTTMTAAVDLAGSLSIAAQSSAAFAASVASPATFDDIDATLSIETALAATLVIDRAMTATLYAEREITAGVYLEV